MLLYLILVAILMAAIIGISFLIVQKRVPPYQPPKVEKKDGLNDFNYLKNSVKKQEDTNEQEAQNESSDSAEDTTKEENTNKKEEVKEKSATEEEKRTKPRKRKLKKQRKRVPKKKININDAIIGKNILDKRG